VKDKRRTEITIETERALVIRRRQGSVLDWCPNCAQQVPMVKVDEAATLCQVTSRAIYRWVEAERVHFAETDEGWLLICLNSLTFHRSIERRPKEVGPAKRGKANHQKS
jgi:hypothetical protein